MPDYIWIAEYEDGTKLLEYKDGVQLLFKDIDQSRLKRFIVTGKGGECTLNFETGEFRIFGIKMFSKTLPNGDKQLIWFKRHRHDFTPKGEKHSVQYVFGIQTTKDNKNHQQLFWIQEDGSVHINGAK